MTPSGSAPKAASPRPLGRKTSSAPGASVVVVLVDVEVVEVVVEVVVDVAAAVVTGVVVDVVPDSVDVVAALSLTVDEEVAPDSVVAGSSSLHEETDSATKTSGTRRIDFTVGSLARFVAIT